MTGEIKKPSDKDHVSFWSLKGGAKSKRKGGGAVIREGGPRVLKEKKEGRTVQKERERAF